MPTIITALAVLLFLALIVGILMYVHERDRKKDISDKKEVSDKTVNM